MLLYNHTAIEAKFWDWKVLESTHFRVYYPKNNLAQALRAVTELEEAIPVVENIIPNTITKVPVIIEDFGQLANGFVHPFKMKMNLMTYTGYFSPYQNYLRFLVVHELAHVAHLSMGENNIFRMIFGDFLYPFNFVPRWFTEGIAIIAESSYSKYEGRLNDARQFNFFKYAAHNRKLKSLSQLTSHFNDQFPHGDTQYWYGSQFLNYVKKQYGQAKVDEFLEEYVENMFSPVISALGSGFPWVSLDLRAKKVFGKSVQLLYKEWQLYEYDHAQSWKVVGKVINNDKSIKKYPLIYNDELYIYQEKTNHPLPHKYYQEYKVLKYNFNTHQWKSMLNLYRRMTQHFEIVNGVLYGSFYNFKSGFSNITQDRYGRIKDIIKIDLKTQKKTILFSDQVDTFTVVKDRIFFVKNEQWKNQSNLYQWRNNIKQKRVTLPISIKEIRSINQKSLIGIGQNSLFQWVIYSIDLNTLKMKTIYTSPWTLSDITINQSDITFTINKGTTLETHQLNISSNQYRRISLGPYADAGVPFKDKLIFTAITDSGNFVYQQNQSDKRLKKPQMKTNKIIKEGVSENIIYHNNTLKQNVKGMLPYSRTPQILGEDELRLLKYQIQYNSRNGVNILAQFKYFLPYQIDYLYQQDSHVFSISRYIYKSLSPGVKDVISGIAYQLDNQSTMLGLITKIQYGFQYDLLNTVNVNQIGNIGINYWHRVTNKTQETIHESSYRINYSHLYMLNNTSLIYKAMLLHNYDLHDQLRGYSTDSLTLQKYSYLSTIDFKHRLGAISRSLWNPIVGFGSVFIGGFIDYSSYKDQYAIGYYGELELLVSSFNIPLTIIAGYSYLFKDTTYLENTYFIEWEYLFGN